MTELQPLNGLTIKESNTLLILLEKHGGSCEPPNPFDKFWTKCIDAGYVKRSDGRFGIERIKDAFVSLTPAGREAMTAYKVRRDEYRAQVDATPVAKSEEAPSHPAV